MSGVDLGARRAARRWIPGNKFSLLENGEEFFPRVFDAISKARREAIVETFILFEDKVGLALRDALVQAAGNGAEVHLTIDGFGSPDLSREFILSLTEAGVKVHVFDPQPKLWGMRTNYLRRMHRKIVVVDAERAFVGGINYSADHLGDFGPEAKQDYSVEVEGPLVGPIHTFVRKALAAGRRNALIASGEARNDREALELVPAPEPLASYPGPKGSADAIFVTRDNRKRVNDIERHYRVAIRASRKRVVIANAYFFPGWRLLREMRRAAKRGVQVSLILQGEPDMAIVKTAAELLYHHLIKAGVDVYEYCDRPLHGKVALSDDSWSTVGSSNLDPLSLSLNLEANVVIRDKEFNRELGEKLGKLMENSCTKIKAEDLRESNWWLVARSFFVFHILRRYPSWTGWLPRHAPGLTPAEHLLEAAKEAARPG